MKSFRTSLRNVAISFACLAATTAFASCEPADEPGADAPAFVEFSFANRRGTSDIDAKKRTVKAVADCGTNLASLAPEFKLSPEGTTATVEGKAQESGKTAQNFTDEVVYTLTTPDGETAEWTVTIKLPDDCPDCGDFLTQKGLEKITSLGKTIKDERVVIRTRSNSWGCEINVFTPDGEHRYKIPEMDEVFSWQCITYSFSYCSKGSSYERNKKIQMNYGTLLDYDDEALWYSYYELVPYWNYQQIYDAYKNNSYYEIVE